MKSKIIWLILYWLALIASAMATAIIGFYTFFGEKYSDDSIQAGNSQGIISDLPAIVQNLVIGPKQRQPPEVIENRVSLVAVGDIMLSRNIGQAMKRKNDYNYPFSKISAFLKSADLTFGNLETAITPGKEVKTGEMLFRADPEAVLGLIKSGFDLVSLANNHTPNFGSDGLLDTFKYLDQGSLAYSGAGKNLDEAREPVVKKIRDLVFAFLSYTDTDVVPPSYGAAEAWPGVVFMNSETLREDITKVKDEVDFIIVSMHSGTEYAIEPNQRQIDFAHQAIDAGAILVIGHHPHVVQKIEKYKGGYIFYSLGNFVFDQLWSEETKEGLAAEIYFNERGIDSVELYPTKIANSLQTEFADNQVAKKILEKMAIPFESQPIFFWNGKDYEKGERLGIYSDSVKVFRSVGQSADLDGDGLAEEAKIIDQVLYFYHKDKIIWKSDSDWQAENVVFADVNNDGNTEMLASLWKDKKYGPNLPFGVKENPRDFANHFFVYRMDKGEVKMIWGSSSLDNPIQEMAAADVNNDSKNELIVLDADYNDSLDASARRLTIWHWQGWNFFNDFTSAEGEFYNLGVKDLGGGKVVEVLAGN